MEKITLKPTAKELIYGSSEDKVHFNVLVYQGVSGQEKMLGSLFILGHIKYTKEDLSYAISLVSSLAKREYYSDESLREQNAKSAFERTLKKLNEILSDFFQNKNFKLNLGLTAISGDNIYISRLGKFKIALARDGKYIDVLNNVDLFSKDAEGEKQFSNIVSGKIHPNDKIFAYFPSRPLTSREKQLSDIFVKENQEKFSQKIAHLAVNMTNFSCCGIHIDMQEVKEIPISTVHTKSLFKTGVSDKPDGNERQTESVIQAELGSADQSSQAGSDKQFQSSPDVQTPQTGLKMEQSQIMPAEFLVSKRVNIFTPVIKSFQKLVSTGRLGERTRRRGFVLISTVILFPTLIIVLLRAGGISSEDKGTIRQASENFELAQSHISQSNLKDARSLLQASLINLTGISNKKAENIKQQINQTLDVLDRVNDKQPVFFTDLSAQNSEFAAKLIASSGSNSANAIDATGLAFTATTNEISQLGRFEVIPQFLFNSSSFVSVFNGLDAISVYDAKPEKINDYRLKDPAPATDAAFYENNLYVLSGNRIYKYADAATGGTKRADWGGDDTAGNQISITIDGNIYTLTGDGKLIKYFKGQKIGELDLRLIPASDSRIFTFKDSAFLFLTDKTNERVYIFDKTTGELKTTYKLDATGTPQDIYISPDGTVWILSADNKIWVIK